MYLMEKTVSRNMSQRHVRQETEIDVSHNNEDDLTSYLTNSLIA